MRVKINNLNDLTDSREILESKPHPFIPIFITILVALIISILVWSYFGEIDTVAKANGIVRPNEKVHTVQVPILGKVEASYIKEGQRVEEGDVLFSIEQEEVSKEFENRNLELKDIEEELSLLNIYKESVQKRENPFSNSEEKEKKYFELVDQYIANYNQLELDFQGTSIDVEQKRHTLEQSLEMTDINIIENEKIFKNETNKYEVEKGLLEEKIEQITLDLMNEKKLKESLIAKQNYLEPDDSVRNSQLSSYQKKIEQLTLSVEEYRKVYSRSAELGERFVSKAQLEKEKNQYDNALIELDNFVNSAILEVDTNIKNLEKQLKQAKTDLKNLVELTDLSKNNNGLHLEKQHLAESIEDMNKQQNLINQSIEGTLKKFELDKIVEINTLIEAEENKKKEITENIEHLDISLNNGVVTASTSGTINIVKEISVGELLQAGETILSIIPDHESQYKVMLSVPNQEIGKIKLGDKVNFHFTAFPKQSFGYLSGEVSSISSDSTIRENGISYYTVEASLTNKSLTDKKGEEREIMIGMTAEASIITESKNILSYLLEKMNFID